MKRHGSAGLFLAWLLVLGFAVAGFAQPLFPEAGGYEGEKNYEGRYVPLNLYWSYEQNGPFRQSQELAALDGVACAESLDALRKRGFWVGTLNDDGRCGPEGDPKVWLLGNFLNFLDGVPAR